MIVEVTPAKELPFHEKYPYVGKSKENGILVLFIEPNSGTVLSDSSPCAYSIGYYSDDWFEQNFDKFEGTITITC